MSTYNTNLASEFYVLSMLHRLGANAFLTLGNKKAVDIIVTSARGTPVTIDVKGVAGPFDWPADNIKLLNQKQHFYVLASFEGKISNAQQVPSVWVVPSKEIKHFLRQYRTRRVISRARVKEHGSKYRHAWWRMLGRGKKV